MPIPNEEPQMLVCNRLTDMYMMHPQQDDSRKCGSCDYPVGIYPSGQKALKRWPNMAIRCVQCAMMTHKLGDKNIPAAETVDEFIAESRASKPVVQQ